MFIGGKTADGKDGTTAIAPVGNGVNLVTVGEEVTSPVSIDIQKILDGVCPKLIPLALTLACTISWQSVTGLQLCASACFW